MIKYFRVQEDIKRDNAAARKMTKYKKKRDGICGKRMQAFVTDAFLERERRYEYLPHLRVSPAPHAPL